MYRQYIDGLRAVAVLSVLMFHVGLGLARGWFCSTGNYIYADGRGLPLYCDEGHINAEGAHIIAPMLDVALRPLIRRPALAGAP
jgi:hypothetical protein